MIYLTYWCWFYICFILWGARFGVFLTVAFWMVRFISFLFFSRCSHQIMARFRVVRVHWVPNGGGGARRHTGAAAAKHSLLPPPLSLSQTDSTPSRGSGAALCHLSPAENKTNRKVEREPCWIQSKGAMHKAWLRAMLHYVSAVCRLPPLISGQKNWGETRVFWKRLLCHRKYWWGVIGARHHERQGSAFIW